LEQVVKIEIFGRPFTFKADGTAERAQEVADFLAGEVARVEKQHKRATSNISDLAVMILAALNIANENFQLKKNHPDFLQHLSDRSALLIRKLDTAGL
jgi:cell division protein ZapA (FtsZ GTPase activity inhibitor)